MASRGKLTGKTLPVLEPASSTETEVNATVIQTQGSSPNFLFATTSLEERYGDAESVSATSEAIRTPSSLELMSEQSNPATSLSSSDFEQLSDRISNLMLDPQVRELLNHYDKEVASVFPWVDGPTNGWRTVMLPLAMKSLSLLYAILALAAEHYSVTSHDNIDSSHYRDKSLRLLSQNLREEMAEEPYANRKDPACATLATILILCNLEMIRSDNEQWTIHWRAVRTITSRWTSPHSSISPLNANFRFLIKEAFVYDTFASSTTFHEGDSIPGSVLTEEDKNIFSDWLEIIQDVTQAERNFHDNPRPSEATINLRDPGVLRHRFEFARQRSLYYSQGVEFSSGSSNLRNDLATLIDIFHYAGILYSFQALLDPAQSASARRDLVNITISAIGQIEECNAFQHDFVWPLFIIGGESRGSRALQQFVDSRVQEAMQSTGFSNCEPSLQFLRRYWESAPEQALNWLQFARQEAKRGFTFLVI